MLRDLLQLRFTGSSSCLSITSGRPLVPYSTGSLTSHPVLPSPLIFLLLTVSPPSWGNPLLASTPLSITPQWCYSAVGSSIGPLSSTESPTFHPTLPYPLVFPLLLVSLPLGGNPLLASTPLTLTAQWCYSYSWRLCWLPLSRSSCYLMAAVPITVRPRLSFPWLSC